MLEYPKSSKTAFGRKERQNECYEVTVADVCTCTVILKCEFKYVLSFFLQNFSNMFSKASRAASVLLYSLWSHTDLHSAYKKVRSGLKQRHVICPFGSRTLSFVLWSP